MNKTTFQIYGLKKKGIVKSNLVLDLDAGNLNSYPGTGNTWIDLTGNGYNGTLINSPVFNPENGGCILFNGTTQRVSLGLVPTALRFTNNFTINIWLKFTNLAGVQTIISCNENAGYGITANYYTPGKVETRFWIKNKFTPTAGQLTSAFNITSWFNITATFNGTNVIFYRNGASIQSVSNVGNITYSSIQPLLIGANPIGSSTAEYHFKGRISQVQLYDRALSTTEILQNFNATKGRFGL